MAKPNEFIFPERSLSNLARWDDASMPDGNLLYWDENRIWVEGKDAWSFDAENLEVRIDSHLFDYPYAYIAVFQGNSDTLSEKWIWTLDLRNGEIVQRISFDHTPVFSATVHAVDEGGLVASVTRRLPDMKNHSLRWQGELIYFQRVSTREAM